MLPVLRRQFYCCLSIVIAAPIVCGGFALGHCFVIEYLNVLSSFVIILLRIRGLVALLLWLS